MKVKIAANSDGEWVFERIVDAASLELPKTPQFTNIDIRVLARQIDRQIKCEIDVSAKAATLCDRCGEPFEFGIDEFLKLRILRVADPDRDSGDDDLKFIGLSQTEIDLTQDIRDLLVLALPMRLTCCE